MVPSSPAKAAKRAKKTAAGFLQPSSASDFFSIDRQTLLLCLALTAAVWAFYYPVIHNGFMNLDDKQYIMDNPPVRAGLTWKTVEWAFTTDREANWHPVTWLSHALDCQLFGLSPVGPHCVNVLLHAANAVLLLLLLQSATGFRWRSLMVAVLFASASDQRRVGRLGVGAEERIERAVSSCSLSMPTSGTRAARDSAVMARWRD